MTKRHRLAQAAHVVSQCSGGRETGIKVFDRAGFSRGHSPWLADGCLLTMSPYCPLHLLEGVLLDSGPCLNDFH